MIPERTPYRDTNAEMKLISYLLRKDHRLCDEIDRDIFSIKAYKIFFDICSSLRSTLPQDILRDELHKRLSKNPDIFNPYLLKIFQFKVDTLTQKNIKTIIVKLEKMKYLRLSLEKAEEIVEAVERGDEEAIRSVARNISLMGTKRKKVYSGELLKDFEERKELIKKRSEMTMVGVPTGVRIFDEASGGIMRGEMGIVVGETGLGKSIALENFAIYPWEKGFNIMFASIEMPKHQIELRADSRLARLKYSKFRMGQLSEEEMIKWEKTIKQYREDRNNFFEIVCLPRSCSANDVEIEAEKIQDQRGKKIDLIVVDYLNIMKPNSGFGSPKDWRNQVDIAWELKEIASDFQGEGVALWTGNQVTDEAEGTDILKKSHVKYGRGIVEVAHIVLGLIRTQDEETENIMKLQPLKVRDLNIEELRDIVVRPNYDFMMLNDETMTISRRVRK